jgi:hypothetical protein
VGEQRSTRVHTGAALLTLRLHSGTRIVVVEDIEARYLSVDDIETL